MTKRYPHDLPQVALIVIGAGCATVGMIIGLAVGWLTMGPGR